MTHSITELTRQYEAAVSRANNAKKAQQTALSALIAELKVVALAEIAEKGIVLGQTLVRLRQGITVSSANYFVVGVEEATWFSKPKVKVTLAKRKADGSPSKAGSGVGGIITPEMLEVVGGDA